MADKKTFTIEINGVEQAYNNVIRLRDAITELDKKEFNIKSNASDVINDIELRTNQLTENVEILNSAYEILNNTIEVNTDNIEANNTQVKESVSANKSIIGSLTQREESIKKLSKEYQKLSDIDRAGESGRVILDKLREEKTALAEATLEMNNFNRETQNQIAVNNEVEESLDHKKTLLKQVESQFSKMTLAEREAAQGKELATKIVDIREDIEDLDNILNSHLATLGNLGSTLYSIGESFKDASNMASNLSTTFSSATEMMGTFGLKSEALNNIVTNLTEVTKTLNTLQSLHTSIISKDSIAMKGATLAKQLYSKATQGSSVALKGFKLALASTGIGAIIVLVGALVTNFDNIKNSVGDAIGGFEQFDGIMSKIEPVIAGVGNALLQYLLMPVKQIMNVVNGLINVFSIFNEKGISGFSDAMSSIGDTATKAGEIVIDSLNVVANYNEGVNEKILSDEAKKRRKLIEEDAKLKEEFIKNSEAKNGENWKFTEEGKAAYEAYFGSLALLYEDDKEKYAQLMRDKDIYNRQHEEFNKPKVTGTKRDYKKEREDYEKHLREIKRKTAEHYATAEEKELAFQKKMAELAMTGKNLDANKKVTAQLKESLDKQTANQQAAFDKQLTDFDKKADEEKTKYKDNAKKLEEITKESEKKRTELIKEQSKERSELIKKQELEVNLEVKRQAVDEIQKIQKEEVALREKAYQQELDDFDSKVTEELAKYKDNEDRQGEIEKAFEDQRKALIKEQNQDRQDQEQKQNEKLLKITQQYKEDYIQNQLEIIAADENLANASKVITDATKKDMFERNSLGLINVKATKENYAKLIEADTKYLAELKVNHGKKVQFLKKELEATEGNANLQKIIKDQLIALDAEYEKSVKDTEDKITTTREESTKTQVKMFEDLHKKLTEKWGDISKAMSEVVESIGAIFDKQIKDIKEKQEEVSQQYEKAVEKHKASQEKLKSLEEEAKTATGGRAMIVQEQIARQMEANNELAKQEKDLAKQKEKLEKDAAKKEKQKKKMELAQGLITGIANIAMGVLKALSLGPIEGPIMASMIKVMGAVQTSTIVKQMTKLEDGGMLRGNRHAQGGMRVEGTNIEVEGDEYVVNRVSTNKNLGLIEYINKNRRELSPTDINSYFARSGSNNNHQVAVAGRRMLEQGGVLTNLEVVDTMSTPNNDKILEALSQINFRPVVSVVDITSAQDSLSEVKDIAGL